MYFCPCIWHFLWLNLKCYMFYLSSVEYGLGRIAQNQKLHLCSVDVIKLQNRYVSFLNLSWCCWDTEVLCDHNSQTAYSSQQLNIHKHIQTMIYWPIKARQLSFYAYFTGCSDQLYFEEQKPLHLTLTAMFKNCRKFYLILNTLPLSDTLG